MTDSISVKEFRKPLIFIIVAFALLAALSSCGASVVTEQFLDSLALVESGDKAAVLGDGGKARGSFQIWRGAWADVNRTYGWTTDYESGSTNRAVARRYARAYCKMLETQMTAAGLRLPTVEHIYACYNLGFNGFARRGFQLSRCPMVTRRAAKRIADLGRTAINFRGDYRAAVTLRAFVMNA